MISGKWKPVIFYYLCHNGEFRFNQLWQLIPRISKKVLTEHLRQLEADNLISRREIDAFPIEVHYSLTERGKKLGDILFELDKFGSGKIDD